MIILCEPNSADTWDFPWMIKMVNSLSVEIKSKQYVKDIIISNEAHDKVLFVAELGELLGLAFVDDEVLEYTGTNGTLRVDLKKEFLWKLLDKNKCQIPCSKLGS